MSRFQFTDLPKKPFWFEANLQSGLVVHVWFFRVQLSEANPGRLGPIGREQHLLTQTARDRETAESLGQKWGVGGPSV